MLTVFQTVLCLSVILTAGMGGQSRDLENLFHIAISHLIASVNLAMITSDFFYSFDYYPVYI